MTDYVYKGYMTHPELEKLLDELGIGEGKGIGDSGGWGEAATHG